MAENYTGTTATQPLPGQQQVVVNVALKKTFGSKVAAYVFSILFIVSVIMNIELLALMAAAKEAGLDKSTYRDGNKEQVIALYAIDGVINEKSAAGVAAFEKIVRDDSKIKAVVLRVNSPGGGVGASDEIYHFVSRIRKDLKRPVVVSMGNVAASGGYYVSAPADEIFAEPSTITGSIGVIAVWPVAKGLMEKIGVETVTIRSTQAQQWKARENYWESPDAQTRTDVLQMLDKMHDRFAQVVKDGRGDKLKISKKQVTTRNADGKDTVYEELTPLNGKTYLTKEAIELGLVDKEGYLDEAIDAAAKLARLDNAKVVRYARSKSLMEGIFGGEDSNSQSLLNSATVENMLTPRIMMIWKPE